MQMQDEYSIWCHCSAAPVHIICDAEFAVKMCRIAEAMQSLCSSVDKTCEISDLSADCKQRHLKRQKVSRCGLPTDDDSSAHSNEASEVGTLEPKACVLPGSNTSKPSHADFG